MHARADPTRSQFMSYELENPMGSKPTSPANEPSSLGGFSRKGIASLACILGPTALAAAGRLTPHGKCVTTNSRTDRRDSCYEPWALKPGASYPLDTPRDLVRGRNAAGAKAEAEARHARNAAARNIFALSNSTPSYFLLLSSKKMSKHTSFFQFAKRDFV